MPSIVLDREEEMKSQTESVVASVRQDGASAEKGLAASDEPTSPVGKKWFLFGFGVLYMLFLLDFAARLGITAVFPAMQKDLGLSDSQVGVAGSAVLLGHDRVCAPLLLFGGQGLEKARRESHVRRLGRGLHTVRPRLTPLPDSARALHGRHRQRQLRARFRIHADQLDPPL